MNVKPKLKTARVELRLTPKQKEHLQNMATLHSISVSGYIIQLLQFPALTDY